MAVRAERVLRALTRGWLVARSVSYRGHEQLTYIICSPEGISSLAVFCKVFPSPS